MRFEEINRKYTEVVNAYIQKGYIINTRTMGGSQGEIAKIDVTDGKEIIRIRLTDMRHGFEMVNGEYFENGGVEIIVGRTAEVKPNINRSFQTIWNDSMDEIESYKFYQIGRKKNWYGTKEEAQQQQRIELARYFRREQTMPVKRDLTMTAKTAKAAYEIINKMPKCSSIRPKHITRVYKEIWKNYYGNIEVRWFAVAKDKLYRLY